MLDAVKSSTPSNGLKYDMVLDFNHILPMPPSVSLTEASTTRDVGKVMAGDATIEEEANAYRWIKVPDSASRNERVAALALRFPTALAVWERSKQAQAETGHQDWYDWCTSNWGTKWNASDSCIPEGGVRKAHTLVKFKTAWSPPLPVVLRLSELFPKNTFVLRYYERGAAYKGVYKVKAGEVLTQMEGEYRGRRGG